MAELVWKKKMVEYAVPICPDCGNEMREETDPDSRTLWHWCCPKCGKKH